MEVFEVKKEFEFPEINVLVFLAANVMNDDSDMPSEDDDDMGWG